MSDLPLGELLEVLSVVRDVISDLAPDLFPSIGRWLIATMYFWVYLLAGY